MLSLAPIGSAITLMLPGTHMKSNNKDSTRLANIFVLVSMSMVFVMLAWNVTLRIDNFNIHQAELADHCVNSAANAVELLVNGYKRAVRIFSEENEIVMNNVALWPQDIEIYSILKNKIDKYFPDNFSFTLASNKGETRLEGFEGLVGNNCKADIRNFAVDDKDYQAYIHGGPDEKLRHFDIMSYWKSDTADNEVFFVTFKPDYLEHILKNTSVIGHHLVLLRRNTPGLVDVSNSSQSELSAGKVLEPDVMQRISHTMPVPGTLWDVAILPKKELYRDAYRSILIQSVLIFLGFLVISIIMRTILLDEN